MKIWTVILLGAFSSSCVSANLELWPPREGDAFPVWVYFCDSHSAVLLPDTERGGWLEVTFAEKAWYVEGLREGCSPCRALFWPSTGVIEERWHPDFLERMKDRYRFDVSPKGLAAIQDYLTECKKSEIPFLSRREHHQYFYISSYNYTVLYTCNTFAAELLQRAGMPIGYSFCATNGELRQRLKSVIDRRRSMKKAH